MATLDELFAALKAAAAAYKTAREDYAKERGDLDNARGVLVAKQQDLKNARAAVLEATDPDKVTASPLPAAAPQSEGTEEE